MGRHSRPVGKINRACKDIRGKNLPLIRLVFRNVIRGLPGITNKRALLVRRECTGRDQQMRFRSVIGTEHNERQKSRRVMRKLLWTGNAVALTAILWAADMLAQTAPAPTLHVSTKIVLVDVVVADHGNDVHGLDRARFHRGQVSTKIFGPEGGTLKAPLTPG
jgi:hypothetical protein